MQFLEYEREGRREGSDQWLCEFAHQGFYVPEKKKLCNFPVFSFYYCFTVTWQKFLRSMKGSLLRTMSHAQFEDESNKSNITFLTLAVSQVIGVAFN